MTKRAKKDRRPLDEAAFRDFCLHIATGKSLRSWAEAEGWAASTVTEWVLKDEARTKEYREARKVQADAHIDTLIELADEEVPVDDMGRMDSAAVNRLRLRIDTRKWIASKFYPALYGDRVAVDASVNLSDKPPEAILDKIVGLLAQHGLRVTPDTPADGPGEPQ